MPIFTRLLSICPRIRKSPGKIVASTAWRWRILSLGLSSRSVTVDREQREIVLRRRLFWVYRRRRRIPFDSIQAISYGYRDMSLGAYLAWAYDSTDLFSVGLLLHGGRPVHLFHFLGDGTFRNDGPLPDWMYWDDFLFDWSGEQEREAKAFVNILSKCTGVPVIPA